MAAGSSGDGSRPAARPGRMHRLLAAAVLPFAVATVVGLVVLWPHHRVRPARDLGVPARLVDATVVDVRDAPCQGGATTCSSVGVRVTSGPDRSKPALLPEVALGPGVPTLRAGDRIVVGRAVDPTTGKVSYYFADYQRARQLLLLALAFAVVVVGVARWRGLAALIGLGTAWLVLVRFVLPAILNGRSPVAVALVGSSVIMFVVLYLAHGFSSRTTTALLGTLASLALTGLLAAVFVAGTHLSGLGSDEATYLQTLAGNISWSGLILGGIVIGSLGVLNDVTVTQASAVWELHDANPARGPRILFRSAMRIGRDHIASTVYTLVLAYAGAALPLLILFTLANQRFSRVLTGELLAEEVVRTLVGSIGLVASVPITTALAALVVTGSALHAHAEPGPGQAQPERTRPTTESVQADAVPARQRRRAGRTVRESWRPPRGEREFWDQE
ncbi:MAG: YibE/F family protein [Actinobacteria bacterium]|nr:MAG: YibE/F family protein [Actinomycetota bacterium]